MPETTAWSGPTPRCLSSGTAGPTFDQLGEPGRLLSELPLTGYYPAVPRLAYLLVGLAPGCAARWRRWSDALRRGATEVRASRG